MIEKSALVAKSLTKWNYKITRPSLMISTIDIYEISGLHVIFNTLIS